MHVGLGRSGLLGVTCVGGCLDSLQQLVVLGVEGNCEGAVDDVPVDVCAKVCSRGRGQFLAASSEAETGQSTCFLAAVCAATTFST